MTDPSPTPPREPGHRIGELADATGVTVRTLHHYEHVGLLAASGRTEAGHRRYSAADVERLSRICLLRGLGLSLGQIGVALDDEEGSLHGALRARLLELEERIETEARLRSRLVRLVASRPAHGSPTTEDLLALMEEMTMLETPLERRISILVYADLEEAFEFLTRVFGLGPGELTRDGDGNVVHGEIEAGDGVVWLHPESPEFGLRSPRSLGATTASHAVMVDDVDAHHRHVVEQGATIDYAPVDQPYGYREYSARDHEGGIWSFMRPLA